MKVVKFKHSGDIGDIIASLGAVKEYCEKNNVLAEYHLDKTSGKGDPYISKHTNRLTKLTEDAALFAKPLLERQPYISKVIIDDGKDFDINLNKFRSGLCDKSVYLKTNNNLLFLHQWVLGLPIGYHGPWIECDDINDSHNLLVSRSARWNGAFQYINDNIILRNLVVDFMGLDFEYEFWKQSFKKYPDKRVNIKTLKDAAEHIKSSKIFLVNPTCFYWVAVGLGHPNILHETPPDHTNTLFPSGVNNVKYLIGARKLTAKQFRLNILPDFNKGFDLNKDEKKSKKCKILVVSASTKNLNWQYEKTNELKKAYCNKWGYDFKFVELDCNPVVGTYQKTGIIEKYLDNYDYVMWVDVDAWFNNFDISLESIISKCGDNKCLILTDHNADVKESAKYYHKSYINAGVVIFKSCDDSKEILHRWQNPNKDAISWMSAMKPGLKDQPFLCTIVLFDKFVNDRTCILPASVMNSFTRSSECRDDSFLIHASGLKMPQANINTWWKQPIEKSFERNKKYILNKNEKIMDLPDKEVKPSEPTPVRSLSVKPNYKGIPIYSGSRSYLNSLNRFRRFDFSKVH